MRLKTFRGGIHPPKNKFTALDAIRPMTVPQLVVIPLQQHVGAPCQPLVKVGDLVKMGQKIGEAKAFVSAPVHASVSGKVKAIGLVDGTLGKKIMAITIENDYQDTPDESISGQKNLDNMTPDDIRNMVREAGIVGLGGAGFPTSVKLSPPADKKIEMLIMNGVECEPYLTCDQRVIIEETDTMILGIRAMMKALGVNHAYIGIKITMEGAIEALHEKILNEKGIDVVPLVPKYPQGEERQLIYAVTGREVPSGGLPHDVGVVVANVATAWAIGRTLQTGMPLIERIMTVGGAVQNPGNFTVRVGTKIEDMMMAVGGYSGTPGSIIVGGPLTGFAQFHTNIPLTKQNNGFVVLTKEQAEPGEMTDCIHCGLCVQACPCRLVPHQLSKYAKNGDTAGLEQFNILDCRECSSCAYVCPAKIPLLHYMRVGKNYVMAKRAEQKK
jgi:electron transport complex protein RnfC